MHGGAVYSDARGGVYENCVFTANTAHHPSAGALGGAFMSFQIPSGFPPTFVHCLFYGNEAVNGYAGGIWGGNDRVKLYDCILWGNRDTTGRSFDAQVAQAPEGGTNIIEGTPMPSAGVDPVAFGGEPRFVDPLGPLFTDPKSRLAYNAIEGWSAGENNGVNVVGNFGDDPMFVDPVGPDAAPGTGDEDFRLMAGSASIDLGDSGAAPVGPALDLAGKARFVDDPGAPNTGPVHAVLPPVDRGAYERQVPHQYEPADINGDGFVDVLDFAIFAANFRTVDTPGVPGDIDGDGNVDVRDFAILASAWSR